MFENIQFQSINFEKPSTQDASEKYLAKYGIAEEKLETGSFYKERKEDIDFLLEGEGKAFFPRPRNSSSKGSLLYLQVFGLMNASSSFYTRRKNYESFLLLYTYQGEGYLEYDNATYDLIPGSIALIDCRRPHYYCTAAAAWEHASFHFNGSGAEYLFRQFYQDGSAVYPCGHPGRFQNDLENILHSCQGNSRFCELETSHLIETCILRILKEKYQKCERIPDYILYLRKYMEHNYTQPLSLGSLSAFANISKFHLAREFKKHTGFTVNEYLIELRLDKAVFLLTTTDIAIGQISQLCGFTNYSNFYKLFIQKNKVSPAAFRENFHS